MTLKFYDEELKIDVRNTMKYKDDMATSQHIEVIDQMVLQENHLGEQKLPLERVLSLSIFEDTQEVGDEEMEVVTLMATQQPVKGS